MVGHFLRLKHTLNRNGLRSSTRKKVGLVFALLFWGWVVAGGFAALATARNQATVLPLIFDGFFVAWLMLPLLGFGGDETLDPSRLSLLPLSNGQVVRGLAVASLLAVPPLGTLLTLTGALAHGGTSHLAPGAATAATPITAAAVVLELFLCIVASRALTTALSGILRSRRGRDLLVFLFAIVAVLPVLAGQLVPHLVLGPNHRSLSLSAARGLFWLPPGWIAKAILNARAGHTATSLVWLAAAAAATALIAYLWSLALRHVLTTSEAGGGKTTRKRADLFARLPFLPRTRVGAIAAKELRYNWRDPRRRAAMVSVGMFIVVPVVTLLSRGGDSHKPVLFAAVGALILGMQAMNQFGSDGPAFWLEVASGRDPADEFRGKNLASVVLGLATATIGATVLGIVLHGMAYVPATILLAGAVLGVTLAVANQVSILAPFPLPDAITNMWAGPGCLPALAGLLALGIIAALLLPVIIAVVIALGSTKTVLLVTAAAAAAYGAIIWRIGLAVATRQLRDRELKVLDIVAGRAGA